MWRFGIGIPRRLFLHHPAILFGQTFCIGLGEFLWCHALFFRRVHIRREAGLESVHRSSQPNQAESMLKLDGVHEGAFKRRPARIIIAGLRLSGVSFLRGPQFRQTALQGGHRLFNALALVPQSALRILGEDDPVQVALICVDPLTLQRRGSRADVYAGQPVEFLGGGYITSFQRVFALY